jgi:hypothetical protein
VLFGPPVLVRNDPFVNFAWGYNAPAAGLPAEGFSARWTRPLQFASGLYRFHVVADDGIRLYVDGDLLIDEWRDGSARELVATRTLSRGVHTLRIEYYEKGGVAIAQVWWEKLNTYPDWKGEYWPNRDLGGAPALVRNDARVDFDWNAFAPAYGLPADGFSARWTRKAHFEAADYRFHALVDDGVRLWVDGKLIINAWYDHSVHEVIADYAMTRGTHDVRVEYYERGGDARIHVWWERIYIPSYPDWKGEYWPNRDLSGAPVLVRNDRQIDFDWELRSPAWGLPVNNFSARWSREVAFEPGVYRFFAWADDAIRVYVDGKPILNEWHGSQDDVYVADMPLSGTYRLVIEYGEHTGDARVRFWWKRLGDLPILRSGRRLVLP